MEKDGKILVERTVATTSEEIRKFIISLGKERSINLVMEPLSQWYFYADFIEALGVKVTLAHPLKVKAIATAKVKTDKIDARTLAHLLRADLIPPAYYAPKQVREWKELSRGRGSLINLQTQVKNKIHAILFRNALIYPRTTLFSKQGRKWMESLELNHVFKAHLASNLAMLDSLSKEISILEKKIKETVIENKEMKLLRTIPGIDFVTAIMIMSEIGDIKRFPNEKKLHSYAGLVPTVRSSGGKTIRGYISKEGSSFLRYIMIQTAQHQRMLKRVVGLKWFYDRMLLKNKNSKTAVVATARKLLTVVFKVLSEGRPFEERLPKIIPGLSSI
jgi:transposase